jgi:hypothetical protein
MPAETPAEFRARAAECERLANEAGNPSARETLLYVASRWFAMAKEDEQRIARLKGTSGHKSVDSK